MTLFSLDGLPDCLIATAPPEIDFHIHAFTSRHGRDMVLDAPGKGCVVIDGHLLRGGVPIGEGLWQSRDQRWCFRLNDQGDLLVEGLQPDLQCHLTVLGWLHRWTSPGRAVGIELEGLGRGGEDLSRPPASTAPPTPSPASAG